MGIGPYYLFHPVPLRWTHHFRPTVEKGLALARYITSCGKFSGRAKPTFAVMTEVGKIVLYEGSILDRDTKGNKLLLQSHYRLEDRMAWNPSWALPPSAVVDENGYLRVWYLNGSDR
jgi:lysine 2,3-aminomutase